jgi:hypothetical protein
MPEPLAAPPAPATKIPPHNIYYYDPAAIDAGVEPYLVAVPRRLPLAGALQHVAGAVMAGPPMDDTRGLITITNGIKSIDVSQAGDVATVKISGDCRNEGSVYTLDGQLRRTLLEVPGIAHVRIIGPGENVADDDLDHRPECMEP